MFKRPKLYYPKARITTNLYTKGKEWMFENGTEYIGYYHSYTDGLVLSEPYYHSIRSEKLIPYSEIRKQESTVIYDSIKDTTNRAPAFAPVPVYTLPTTDDYAHGFFKRYFIYRKNLKNIYLEFYEVNDIQYKLWQKPNAGIDEKLYDGFIIDWKLTGPLHDIKENNDIKEFGVHDTNKRLVYLNERKYPMISKILTDYTEHSIYSLLTPEEIRKQFGNM
jgi:hypothetical protein